MYNYIFKKMVTWLQIEFSPVIGMSLGVTKLVTNGYNGYKRFKSVQVVSFSVQKVHKKFKRFKIKVDSP